MHGQQNFMNDDPVILTGLADKSFDGVFAWQSHDRAAQVQQTVPKVL